MELEAVLKKILDRFNDDFQESSRIRALEKIISEGADQYKYAEEMAREVGKILNGALRTYLPEALTNGMLYRKAAEVVLKQPMLKAVKPVSDAASSVQKNINAQAGIGINPIIPEVNEDQVNGIITGICNAESYESGKETLFDQVENFLEGHVDDSVYDNAGFQYEAGLDPTVTRTAAAKCCKWCDQLAGTYDYEKVKNKGNDVWRRHKNCHCVINYNPGEKSSAKNRKPRFTKNEKADRIAMANNSDNVFEHKRVYNSDARNGLPITGSSNSILDKLADDGTVLQRRIYGQDGRAVADYDMTDHNRPDLHPTGAHKHLFEYINGKAVRSKKNYGFTKEEIQRNSDIIFPGVNYYDERRID